MKNFTTLLLSIIFISNLFANPVTEANNEQFFSISDSKIVNVQLVEQYQSCSVYRVETEDGMVFWNVIASIAVQFLPDMAYEICMKTVGDPDICQAVYDVSSVVVMLSGGNIQKGITKGLYWIARKTYTKATATIGTQTYDLVGYIKDVFDYYRDINCINWESINSTKENFDYSGAKPYYNSHKVNCHTNDNSPLGVTESFIKDLGKQYFYTAYNKTKNKAWNSYTHFKSKQAFGGINKTMIVDIKQSSNNGYNAIVWTDYYVWDPLHDNKHYKINYHLQKFSSDWKITKITVLSSEIF